MIEAPGPIPIPAEKIEAFRKLQEIAVALDIDLPTLLQSILITSDEDTTDVMDVHARLVQRVSGSPPELYGELTRDDIDTFLLIQITLARAVYRTTQTFLSEFTE